MRVTRASGRIELVALDDLPLVRSGDDLVQLIGDALDRRGLGLSPDDVVVVAQKIVSKAEGRVLDLAGVMPTDEARRIAAQSGKDAPFVEAVLGESCRIVRVRKDLVIAEHRLGWTMANAGIDRSNVEDETCVLLLPLDPDASAAALRRGLAERFGEGAAVIVSDSFGRPWRQGVCGVAIGCAGLPAVVDRRGHPDLFGRPLKVTTIGFADQIAAAASLVMGEADEGRPVVLVRGLSWSAAPSRAADIVRPAAEDLFR